MRQTRKTEPAIRRIAVVRANGIGDFVFSIPALEALRATYPDAEIVLFGKPWHAVFLNGRPGPLDRVEVVPPCPGVGEAEDHIPDESQLNAFFAAARAYKYNLAVQLHGGGRYSNPFTRQLGAALTIGLRTPDAEALDRWVPYIYFQSEVMRYLEVVSLVGAPPVVIEPHIAVTDADLVEANAFLPDADRPLAVIHPGATDTRRHWPAEKFAAVGDALVDAGARVAVIGAEAEGDIVDEVLAAMKRPAHNLCARLSLGGLAGLLSRAVVTVANDSGPLHLAGAVGAATVGIYWCGNLVTSGPPTRARHRPATSWRIHCPVCDADTLKVACSHKASFVADVPVDEVRDAALDLLANA